MTTIVIEIYKITREEWIDYKWVECTQYADEERKFMLTGKSTPSERAAKIAEYELIDREEARRKGQE